MNKKLQIENYKGFLFDLDGTLIPQIWPEAYCVYIKNHGGKPRRDKINHEIEEILVRNFSCPDINNTLYKEINSLYGIRGIHPSMSYKIVLDIAKDMWRGLSYKPGAPRFLNYLRERDIPMAIVTQSIPEEIEVLRDDNENICIVADIGYIFGSRIIDKNSVTKRKPDPEGFLKGTRLLGLTPADVLAFEDTPIGVRAAKAAGLSVCAVYDIESADKWEEIKSLADYHIMSWEELQLN